MPYQAIENYGVMGNMHTAALVGMNGSIDWYCPSNFDSPSVFGAILVSRCCRAWGSFRETSGNRDLPGNVVNGRSW
jgi:GH15 family glucan-1,4-alpha-glucosidase